LFQKPQMTCIFRRIFPVSILALTQEKINHSRRGKASTENMI
jgi:hypothetical protein